MWDRKRGEGEIFRMKLSTKLRGILAILALLLLLAPASAQVVPQLSLYVNWTPKEQLTSFDENGINGIETSEERFVTAQIYVNSNVQFWALDLSCRIGTGAELELVDVTYPSGTWDTPEPDNQYLANPGLGVLQSRYNPSPGVAGGFLALTITRVGNNTPPVGINGVSTSLHVATLRFKVKNRVSDAAVPTTCTIIRTLDRNGRQALVGRLGSFTNLFVRIGYTLKGTALRQGAVNNLNIQVICTHLATESEYIAYTLSNGTFTFGGATLTSQPNHLRHYGLYECIYQSDLDDDFVLVEDNADRHFLRAKSYINLTTPRYQLMPVTIRPGDFDPAYDPLAPTPPNNLIDLNDLNVITGNFNTVQTIFTKGDANGDTRVNQSDLALVASNVGLEDVPAIVSEHALYSLGTDYNATFAFPNSRVQMGTPESGAIVRRNPVSATRDFWATLSPDGSEYAYVSVNAAGLHSLMIGNMVNGAGVATRLPVGFRYPHSLAPSWSPDGSLLAWVCGESDDLVGIHFNEGHLCYRNRGDILGNSVTILKSADGTDINTEIFPPAWFSYPLGDGIGYALIYSDNETLKYYDLTSNIGGVLSDLPVGADMPVVVNHWTGDSFLFYRFDTNTNPLNPPAYRLHVARLELGNTYLVDTDSGNIIPDGLTFATAAPFGTAGTSAAPDAEGVHMVVDSTNSVEYYDVSPMLDIMLYTNIAGDNITNLYFEASPDPTDPPLLDIHFWSSPLLHFVDGNIGSPLEIIGSFGNEWTGDDSDPTMYHAQRVTFDWVP
jgi:hypothetical protein